MLCEKIILSVKGAVSFISFWKSKFNQDDYLQASTELSTNAHLKIHQIFISAFLFTELWRDCLLITKLTRHFKNLNS